MAKEKPYIDAEFTVVRGPKHPYYPPPPRRPPPTRAARRRHAILQLGVTLLIVLSGINARHQSELAEQTERAAR